MGDKIDKALKRGNYKKKECPHCHKMMGNLGNHIKLAHPTEAENTPAPALDKETMIKGEKPPAQDKPEDVEYICEDCHAEIRKGEAVCWHCGETLIWEALENGK